MPVLDLLQVQVFKETTWATTGTPTVRLMGIEKFKFKPLQKTERTKELHASVAKAFNAQVVEVKGEAEIEGYCTYEDINYFLESIVGVVAPTGVGPYVRAGACPLQAAIPAPRMMSFYYGDATGAYALVGGLVQKLTITGKWGQICKFKAGLIGQQVTTGVSLAALSDRVVTVISPDQVSVYIDAWAGTVGTTIIPTTFHEFELTIDAGRVLKPYLGNLPPQAYDQVWIDASLKLKAEYNATYSKAMLDSLLTSSAVYQKQVRLKATTGSTRIMQFDFAGVAEAAPNDLFPDRERVTGFDLELKAQYNTTLANQWLYSNTNSVAVLP